MANKIKQLSYWQGEFGDEYIKRNSDLSFFEKRKVFFEQILNKHPGIKTILEIGSNIGGNLHILYKINPTLTLFAVEPNKKASEKAQELNPYAKIYNQSVYDFHTEQKFDLVFTAGVLIHIADNEIASALEKIYTSSQKYILTIEYFSPQREKIIYRGLDDALFKRPYNSEWINLYPNLKLLGEGDLTIDQGFDNCHWWLFKK